jgi:hypothetical protein
MNCDLTVSEVFKAYYDCRKAKRNTWNALLFEENLERNLMNLYYELISCKYKPGKSIMFVVTRPKYREVWAADFKDRVVHHILYNRYSAKFHNSFIYDSYACIPEKGTLKACNRIERFIKSALANNTKKVWFLKADIANFFVSIDKQILDNMLQKKINDPWWVWLMQIILHKDAKENVYIKSNKTLLNKVPKHKSLLNAAHGYGLPIGNLSSQFFANVYLNELDQYAKHTLKLKYYARYVDDIVVLGKSGKELNIVYTNMIKFVQNNLKLNFHPNKKEINLIDHGVNFVGYIIKPYCKYLRRTIINNLYKKCKEKKDFNSLRATVNSYFGMLTNVNGFKERKNAAKVLSKKGCWFNGKLTKIVRQDKSKCIYV